MTRFSIKRCILLLLVFTINIRAERIYPPVERKIVPDHRISVNQNSYTLLSGESQIYLDEWQSSQKVLYEYDNEGKLQHYAVITWDATLNAWTDSMYCMFFYDSGKPISYQVSPIYADTVSSVIYKEYYSYDNTINKLVDMVSFTTNSKDSLVLYSKEDYVYSQLLELDSITTVGYDIEQNYTWRITTEEVRYANDTMYSIFENNIYTPHPDSASISFENEHQYFFSRDGKKKMQGKCLIPGLITERILYSYREEDGLPAMELSQNIDSFVDMTYKDTTRIIYSYSFDDQLMIQTATTEIRSAESWIPVSREIDTYTSHAVTARKYEMIAGSRPQCVDAYLTRSAHPALIISSPERIKSVDLFALDGALLLSNKISGNKDRIVLKLSNCASANYNGPVIVHVRMENGYASTKKIFRIR